MTPGDDWAMLHVVPSRDLDPVAKARVYNARRRAAERLAAWAAKLPRIEAPLARWEWRR